VTPQFPPSPPPIPYDSNFKFLYVDLQRNIVLRTGIIKFKFARKTNEIRDWKEKAVKDGIKL
jgi:hypothetical protein